MKEKFDWFGWIFWSIEKFIYFGAFGIVVLVFEGWAFVLLLLFLVQLILVRAFEWGKK
jgi:hypothetical protein